MDEDSSITSCDTLTVMLKSADVYKHSLEQLDKLRAASDARRGYSIATKQIEHPDQMSLDAFAEWAKSIGNDVPQEYRESAVVDMSYDMDYGLEISVSWRVPLK